MELRTYVMNKVNPNSYYRFILGNESGNMVCPFHKDDNPSLHIRVDGTAHCYGCNKKWRNIIEFDQEYHKSTLQKTLYYLFNNFIEPLITRSTYIAYAGNLKKGSKPHKWLLNRGIGDATIVRFFIGYDANSNKITLPIFNEWGFCVNLRLFRFEDDSPWKVINFKKGYGKPRLFPYSSLHHKEIYIFEGEMDTLLAIHLGLNALTVTAGAQGWRKEFTPYFKDKIVYVCMDNDPAGLAGSKNIIKELKGLASKLYNIIIPTKYGKDFTDFISHRPIESFLSLVDKTREIVKPELADFSRVKEMEEYSQEERMIIELKPNKNLLHLIIKITPDEQNL